MTDEQLQRRINRQLDVTGIKDKAIIVLAIALGVLILWAYVVST